MHVYTYNDYLKWKKYFSYTSPCNISETPTPYIVCSNEELQINNIHDKCYRKLLNNKNEFVLFLNKFLHCNILSSNLYKYNCDFITYDFHDNRSDIVYKIKDENVYIFLEHQSTIDNSISYRIYRYYSLLLHDTVDKNSLKNKDYLFPLIIPIVLYSGEHIWNLIPNLTSKQSKSRFFDNELELAYHFISIHNYSIKQLLASNTAIGYMLATDKCKSKEELYDVLNNLANMNIVDSQKEILQQFIYFIFGKSFSKEIKNELIEKFKKGVDKNMKCAWQYLIEDIRRDRAEGKAEGEAEGQRSAKISFVKRMLKNGESIEKIKLYSGCNYKEIKDIQKELNSK